MRVEKRPASAVFDFQRGESLPDRLATASVRESSAQQQQQFHVDCETVHPPCRDPVVDGVQRHAVDRSEEHTSELQSLMRISYAVFCLKKTIHDFTPNITHTNTKHNNMYST